MQLLAISVGLPRSVEYQGRLEQTGIFKEPVAGSVRVGVTGVEGDGQADRKNHGGKDKAVYAYTVENVRYWETDLARPNLPFGQFGENLTVTGMPDEVVCIGDEFQIGGVRLQVSQPRVPCFKLGLRFGLPDFPARFLTSGRCGMYFRVLEPGLMRAGDVITRIRTHPARLNLADAMLAVRQGPRQIEIILRALEVDALSEVWRDDLTRRLEKG